MVEGKPSPSSGNPSPEPSAESLAEAQEVYAWLTRPQHGYLIERRIWPNDSERAVASIAEVIQAVKRSSRRGALRQAVKLADNARVIHFAETMGENEASRTAHRIAVALHALMEAE